MTDEPQGRIGRRSTDSDLAVVVQRLDDFERNLAEDRKETNKKLDAVHTQTKETNGRVSELEIRERIREDREKQASIAAAAAEAAEAKVAAETEQAEEKHRHRVTWRMALLATVVGVLGSFLVAVLLHALYSSP